MRGVVIIKIENLGRDRVVQAMQMRNYTNERLQEDGRIELIRGRGSVEKRRRKNRRKSCVKRGIRMRRMGNPLHGSGVGYRKHQNLRRKRLRLSRKRRSGTGKGGSSRIVQRL